MISESSRGQVYQHNDRYQEARNDSSGLSEYALIAQSILAEVRTAGVVSIKGSSTVHQDIKKDWRLPVTCMGFLKCRNARAARNLPLAA
jgi:hypothetical protein